MTVDGKPRRFIVLDEVRQRQSTYPDKIIHLQRVKFLDDDHVEYRLCYWIKGKKPRVARKWVFGQFAPFMPPKDLKVIFRKAAKKGWLNKAS